VFQESDRVQLHSDAKRLFYDEDIGTGAENEWETHYNSKYRSRRQAARHAERDGTAFASIALPAHYSAILSVFDHLKRRLGPTWKVERIIDWGAGTGSGLWFDLFSRALPTLNPRHFSGPHCTLSKTPPLWEVTVVNIKVRN